jgi:hypothetical protein
MAGVDARTKLLDELAARYMTPTLTAAGFRKLGKRGWLAGEAPDNLVLVDMRPHHTDHDHVGFWIEWAVIPAAMCDYRRRDGKAKKPDVTWGILGDRVDVPVEAMAPVNVTTSPDHWTFSVDGGLDECGAALQRLLTEGGVLARLSSMHDREGMLRLLEGDTFRFRLPPGTPNAWPMRYLAMYIDDGDPEVLEDLISSLEEKYPEPAPTVIWKQKNYELTVWWRERLDNRLAEHRT